MTTERRGPGAPPGLTVHWLEMELRPHFRKEYVLTYNPNHHMSDIISVLWSTNSLLSVLRSGVIG